MSTIIKMRGKLHNLFWEMKLGINTRGIQQVPEVVDNHYGTTGYASIMATLHSLKMQPSDVFMDIGCGKGRVVCCASRYKLKKVIGVEINEGLSKRARQNSHKVRGRRSDVEIANAPAEGVDYRDTTIIYFFHPFSADILRLVLDRIQGSLDFNPRKIKIAYVEPAHEYVLEKTEWLERYNRWEPGHITGMNNAVSFWRSSLDAATALGLKS